MNSELVEVIKKCNLLRLQDSLEKYLLPTVSFDLQEFNSELPIGSSKLGGKPDLPSGFVWPENNGRPLEFLLQIDLARASKLDRSNLLPGSGLLSFFYDIEAQPWGFDPKGVSGFKVLYSAGAEQLQRWETPETKYGLNEFELILRSGFSLPDSTSPCFNSLELEAEFDIEESNRYWDLLGELELLGSSYHHRFGGRHHLLGHSHNIQGDMKLEAQLVTNGLYCGDASGYKDPRREILEKTAEDWILLLQLDSDEPGGIMWGDTGMLYFWIKKQDLAECHFDKAWAILQCG